MKDALERLTPDGVMPPKEEKNEVGRGEWIAGE